MSGNRRYPVYDEISRKCEPPPYEVLRPYDITADNLQDKIEEAVSDYITYGDMRDPKLVRADLLRCGFQKNAVSQDVEDLAHHVRDRHSDLSNAGWRQRETPQGMNQEIFNKYRMYISEASLWKATFLNNMDNRREGRELYFWKQALREFIEFYRDLESVGGGH
jgi:hypothetical protein